MIQGRKHTIKENKTYFLTLTVINWVDVFARKGQRDLLIDSLRYCVHNKGLNIYAYVIMTNHMHMIVNSDEPFQLKDTIRDFKKYTSKEIIRKIYGMPLCRRRWLLRIFREEAGRSPKHEKFKVWKAGNHAIELYRPGFSWIKLNYIHKNPVKAGYVSRPEDWRYSSAPNYAGLDNCLLEEVYCLSPPLASQDL